MKNREYEGDVCSHKIAFLLDNFLRRILQNPVKIVGEYLKEGNKALDIGCGPGFFTIDMAKIVGKKGKVTAVDLQPEMLEKVKKKAKKYNLADRIDLHRCMQDSIGLSDETKADFILLFYMLHETKEPEKLLDEIRNMLKKDGKILIVEPKLHVSEELFKETEEIAVKKGFKVIDKPTDKGGRAMVLSV